MKNIYLSVICLLSLSSCGKKPFEVGDKVRFKNTSITAIVEFPGYTASTVYYEDDFGQIQNPTFRNDVLEKVD